MREIIDLRSTEPGKVLCDMHYGLSQLETRITGFKLLHHATIRTEHGAEFVRSLLAENGIEYPTVHNKLLYLIDQDNAGNYKAVYTYDGHMFGIVTFNTSHKG